MKKIILFTDSLGAGGAQRQIVGLAIMLRDAGYDIIVATYYDIDFYKAQLDEAGICNVLIPNADNRRKRIWAVRSFFKKEQPDWVVAYLETPSLVACIAKTTGCKFKLIVSERNTTQRIGMNERVRFSLFRYADIIVPNCYTQGNFLATHYPWMKKKLTTISNFVDLNRFEFSIREKRKKPLIVVAATIWKPKNTLGFIHAVKILKDKGFYFSVEWYGISEADSDSDYFKQCRELMAYLDVDDYIQLLPKSKQIQDKYKYCDFFCLPSFYEGTPNVICEAMSCGRPIICSDVCDNHIYVAEGENGYLFNPHEPKTIAAAIEKALLVTADDYSLMCRQSRERAERLLSQKTFVDKYIKIIEGR